MTTTDTTPAASGCEFRHEVWGPHEGCREFMSEPDTFPCGDPATTLIVVHDHYYEAATGDDGRTELRLCDQHAEDTRAGIIEGYDEIVRDTRIEVAA